MSNFELNGSVVLAYVQDEHKGIIRVINWVADDFEKVFGVRPEVRALAVDEEPKGKNVIVAGCACSDSMNKIMSQNGVDETPLRKEDGTFKWEVNLRAVCDGLLIIAGSDKRGTI